MLGARAIRIYFYYALSSAAMILLITAARDIWGNQFHTDEYVSGVMKHTDPVMAMWSALSLISPPDLSDILVFYMAMTLVAVPILIAGFRYRATATLAASASFGDFHRVFRVLRSPLKDIGRSIRLHGSSYSRLGCSLERDGNPLYPICNLQS